MSSIYSQTAWKFMIIRGCCVTSYSCFAIRMIMFCHTDYHCRCELYRGVGFFKKASDHESLKIKQPRINNLEDGFVCVLYISVLNGASKNPMRRVCVCVCVCCVCWGGTNTLCLACISLFSNLVIGGEGRVSVGAVITFNNPFSRQRHGSECCLQEP